MTKKDEPPKRPSSKTVVIDRSQLPPIVSTGDYSEDDITTLLHCPVCSKCTRCGGRHAFQCSECQIFRTCPACVLCYYCDGEHMVTPEKFAAYGKPDPETSDPK